MPVRWDEKYVNILALIRQCDVPPSIREISRAIGMSISGTWERLKKLEKHGYITHGGKYMARSFAITEDGKRILPELIVARMEDGVLKLVRSVR